MSKKIIGYKFMQHRASGMPAGAATPVFKDDWPHWVPPPSQIVWRYLDLWKFEDMLRGAALYFCRCDKFPDPLEGRLSKLGVHGTSPTDKAFFAAYAMADDYNERASEQEIARGCMFVNCWHMNTRESARMWKEYTQTADSIVITSSVKALKRVIPQQEISISAVRYVEADFPRTEFYNSSIFLYKDVSFRHERELRLLRPLLAHEKVFVDRKEDFGRSISVHLKLLVHRVILNRGISEAARQRATELVRKFCPRAIVQESSL